MRRTVILALSIATAAAVAPAAAAPVETGGVAAVRFAVPAADGTRLQLGLRAMQTSVGDRLVVALERCTPTCSPPAYHEGTLPKGAFTVDPQAVRARLDVVLGGLPITVDWTQSGSTAVAGGAEGGGTDESLVVGAYNGEPARARVVVPAGSCSGVGTVGNHVRIATSDAGNGGAAMLSELRLRDTGASVCAG